MIFRFRLLRTKSHTLFSSQTIAHSDPAIQLINRERSFLLCVLLEAFKSVVSMSSLDHPPYGSKNSLILVDVSCSSGRLSVCHKYVLSLDHPFLSKISTPSFEALIRLHFNCLMQYIRSETSNFSIDDTFGSFLCDSSMNHRLYALLCCN